MIKADPGRIVRRAGIAAIILGASFALSGCAALSLLGSEAPPATYDLRASPTGKFGGRIGGQLSVREPQAIQVLDNERIVIRPNAQLINYYADSQWADRLPKLVEQRLLAAFEQATNLKTVSRSSDGLSVDYQLLTEIRDFGVVDGTDGRFAEVRIHAKLVVDSAGRALSGRLFDARVPVNGTGVDVAVASLDAALAQVLTELVRWTAGRV